MAKKRTTSRWFLLRHGNDGLMTVRTVQKKTAEEALASLDPEVLKFREAHFGSMSIEAISEKRFNKLREGSL